jgi:uncharacterized protein (DUF1499 family)
MNVLVARLAFVAGLVAALLIGLAGPLYRFAGLDLGTVFFTMFPAGVYTALAAIALALVWLLLAFLRRSGEGLLLVIVGLILAGSAYVPLNMKATGDALPKIHDITTDTANPPPFVALLDARKASKNGADYKPEIAAEQQKAYADIQPLVLPDVTPDAAFKRAETAARAMGWEIAAAEAGEGRIEATDTTLWFGFKDDIVIRIAAEGAGSKLDVRSMSRVGLSDMGKNAARIRAFFAKFKETK